MKYLLDTGPLTAYLRGRQGAIARFGPWILQGEAATTLFNYGEVIEALLAFPQTLTGYRADFQELLHHHLPLLVPDIAIMEQYATMRRTMRTLRTPQGQNVGLIGDIDSVIAATALAHHLTVITIDSDFIRVPGLSVQLLSSSDLRLL